MAKPLLAPRRPANANMAVPADPASPLKRREGPVMRGARNIWNAAISLMLGTMIGLIGHQFAAEAIARLWPETAFVADAARAFFWLLGAGATGVLFFSYYLDDTGR